MNRHGPSHLLRHPSKTHYIAAFKNHFFGIRYHNPQNGALTIYDCMQPALRKVYLLPKTLFLKGALEEFLRS